MKPEERWAVVHYVQSLRRTDVAVNDLLAPENSAIRVTRWRRLPTDPMDNFWESLDRCACRSIHSGLSQTGLCRGGFGAVTDGKQLAVLLQWRDELPQNSAIRVQDFQDGAALQFSLSGKYGFLGMGDKENPVNLWSWKAGWQAEGTPDMDSVYQSMHSDAWTFTNFSTAISAGNVVSQPHKSPVEDANAAGFGSFKSQPIAQQNVAGKGVWHDGFWNVVFIRDLKSKDADDVKFVAGKSVPVAFADLERRAA